MIFFYVLFYYETFTRGDDQNILLSLWLFLETITMVISLSTKSN
jgi:hypothetical protein